MRQLWHCSFQYWRKKFKSLLKKKDASPDFYVFRLASIHKETDNILSTVESEKEEGVEIKALQRSSIPALEMSCRKDYRQQAKMIMK